MEARISSIEGSCTFAACDMARIPATDRVGNRIPNHRGAVFARQVRAQVWHVKGRRQASGGETRAQSYKVLWIDDQRPSGVRTPIQASRIWW
jgi:hypothetical protein